MNSKNNFKKGSVELVVLSLLQQEGDCYGYQLTQMIAERSQGFLTVPEGSLYPSLYRLIEKGYISDRRELVGKRMTRVYYHIEPSGLEYYNKILQDYTEVHTGVHYILNYSPKNSEQK